MIGWRNVSEELGWLSAVEALARLKIRPQTLYAYVSRGRIQTRASLTDPRRKLYSQPDVERLANMSRSIRRPSAIAASAIAWGEPMLSSTISTVHSGRLIYRGADAVTLSASATLEEVARLLWQLPADPFAGASKPAIDGKKGDGIARALTSLAHLAAGVDAQPSQTAADRARELATIVYVVATACGQHRWRPSEPIHEYLARSWKAPKAADPIRRALVLLADHELNVSTFAVRVTASSGASLPACVLAGLCTLTGPLHGRAAVEVQALVDASECPENPASTLARSLPGFGHRLYAGIDGRAAALLDSFEEPERHA